MIGRSSFLRNAKPPCTDFCSLMAIASFHLLAHVAKERAIIRKFFKELPSINNMGALRLNIVKF